MNGKNVYRFLLLGTCSFLLVVVLVLLLVAGSGSRVQAAGEARSGGGYTLVPLTLPQGILAHGGAYTLLQPASSILAPGGCCCTYLPCLLR